MVCSYHTKIMDQHSTQIGNLSAIFIIANKIWIQYRLSPFAWISLFVLLSWIETDHFDQKNHWLFGINWNIYIGLGWYKAGTFYGCWIFLSLRQFHKVCQFNQFCRQIVKYVEIFLMYSHSWAITEYQQDFYTNFLKFDVSLVIEYNC